MAWWPKWTKRGGSQTGGEPQSVIVHIKLSGGEHGSEEERDSVHRMTDRLAEVIAIAKAGEFDGDEFGGGECTLYMYGPDANRIFSLIFPLLKDWEPLKGGYALKRYGPPGSPTEKVTFE